MKDQKKELNSLEAAVKAKKQNAGSGFDLFEKIDNLGRKQSNAGHRRGKVKASGGCAACKRYFASKEKGGWVTMRDREIRRRRLEQIPWGEYPGEEFGRIREGKLKGKRLIDIIKEHERNNKPPSSYKGGKLEGRDVIDFLAGPIGWTIMGVRKSREKKIDKLKKELNGGMIGHDAKVYLPLETPSYSPYKLAPKLSLALDGYKPQQQATLLTAMDEFNRRNDSQ